MLLPKDFATLERIQEMRRKLLLKQVKPWPGKETAGPGLKKGLPARITIEQETEPCREPDVWDKKGESRAPREVAP